MIIYKDLVTGDEIISDSYGLKDVDNVVYEIDCKRITKGGVNVDIGANPSAEGEDADALEEGAEQVIDVIDSFRLVSIPFGDKKGFAGQLKGFMKKAKDQWTAKGKSEDEIKDLQKGIQGYFTKHLSPNFKDLEFFTGESMDPDGM
ncbi:uncharacterized protein KY384_006653 [Bacidia gigantensis]|uniref:uncharacterized protein n=1 Tax=Bacidia gigantensis TaxID=2732470 RepID=UPI001D052FBD|nr:uncharacterized protein KY384_006653 [Bacidia gigantensis]KAG8528964.1 hypothetical protein KY384_006653 [Bacidia gigantensis]